MKKTRWGILSTANIGVQKVIPAIMKAHNCEVLAISSREYSKAAEAARNLGIPRAYGSYEELLNDPEIDIVYNPLPNHLHVPLTLKALEAGKHVLCEKPIALNAVEAERFVADAARFPYLKVMEAFMYRFHPQWIKAKELVLSGTIGQVKTIHSFFTYYNLNPYNIRNQADIGGGGLLDIGCYCISFPRFIFEEEPAQVMGLIDFDPVMKTDRLASALLRFSSGKTATFTCSTQLYPFQRVQILGSLGRIEIEMPVNGNPAEPIWLWVFHDNKSEEFVYQDVDQYQLQAEAFARAVLNNEEVPTPLSDALANMKVIDAIFESGKGKTFKEI